MGCYIWWWAKWDCDTDDADHIDAVDTLVMWVALDGTLS